MPSYVCKYCHQSKQSLKGLRSHLAQKKSCRDAFRRRFSAIIQATSSITQGQREADQFEDDPDSQLDVDEPAPFDPPNLHSHNPPPTDNEPPPNTTSHSRRASVEDVEDEEPGGLPKRAWVTDFPSPAGTALREGETAFAKLQREKEEAGGNLWLPFASKDEWELARWLTTAGVSQSAIDDFLKLPITRDRTHPSFHNKRTFFQKIDTLPQGPAWSCESWEVTGDELNEKGEPIVETVELWKRNTVDCIQELIGNPAFKDNMQYAPEKLYAEEECKTRIFDETWTGEWWWDKQKVFPAGVTIAPVILSSDKTQLSQFSGDKAAWPPLIEAGNQGVEMVCADGCVRRVHPILAAYIADHPEQCLVACCKENCCPKCTVPPDRRGEVVYSVMRDPREIEQLLEEKWKGESPADFKAYGLRLIDPFWKDLPHCNIFACITPDLLHQLHKGVFKDHIVSWASACMEGGEAEIDRRFKVMTTHPDLRHFRKGISLVSQWTGTEYKNMEKVFLGVLTGGSNPAVLRAVRAVLDFIYYAHFEAHSSDSLAKLEAAWNSFHAEKSIFVDLDIRDDFDIAKVHSALHYGQSIRQLGTADGYNTEASERLHIDFAKRAYRSSNKKAYTQQMTTWLSRQEAVRRFDAFLRWAEPQPLVSEIPQTEQDSQHDEQPTSLARYSVAKDPGFGATKVKTLVEKFGCANFVRNLEDHLRRFSSSQPLPLVAQNIHDRTSFDVYKRMHVRLPAIRQISRTPIKDTIRATPSVPAKPLRKAIPAHFDTVLAREFPSPVDPSGHNQDNPLHGLCVARVRAIFRLPEEYGPASKHPVAYMEWFTPFHTVAPDTGMFKISWSTRMHRRRTSIIPVTQIERSCHLIPHFGREVNLQWSSGDILDQCSTFYVNPYLRHHDFVLLRHAVAGTVT
ncbi:hypothetical protein B0H21DRAFT_836254 [Amylocystis lapponica]|nr:hypothetical protein B0H21DRAFT_836254 [Amylocystis lapponica]